MKRVLPLVLLCIAAAALAQSKRAFTIEDLYRAKGVGELTLSPDGKTLAFTVTTSDLPRAKRTTKIWLMDADGQNARAVTNGAGDSSPHFSPDGKQLSFSRDSNIYLLPLAGGEAKQLTSISTGVSDPLWSPNGSGSPSPPTSIPSAAPTTPATRRSPSA